MTTHDSNRVTFPLRDAGWKDVTRDWVGLPEGYKVSAKSPLRGYTYTWTTYEMVLQTLAEHKADGAAV